MLTGAMSGALELRAETDGGARITGRFPYGAEAELAPGRREVFAPGSLEPRADAVLLAHHDFARPLASVQAGTLTLRSEAEALILDARIAPEVARTSHGADALALIRAGLAVGLSPGFRVAPGGETVERRGDALLRTVRRAALGEMSIVTRPAFAEAGVEARCWQPPGAARPLHSSSRWR
jgi:HK97 family phage prohead protease